ncbi:MAG: hypothetical protein R3204_14845, partial [Oceanospirillum sp.]|nr:hypothetical protein [Oceanospirillum sp.]
HEQALLYLLYSLKKGIETCTDRETALRTNLRFTLKDAKMTATAQQQLKNLLALVVDEDIAQAIIIGLSSDLSDS